MKKGEREFYLFKIPILDKIYVSFLHSIDFLFLIGAVVLVWFYQARLTESCILLFLSYILWESNHKKFETVMGRRPHLICTGLYSILVLAWGLRVLLQIPKTEPMLFFLIMISMILGVGQDCMPID